MSESTGVAGGGPRLTAAHASLAAIGLMWTLPFLQPFHRFPLTSFYSEWLAIVLGLIALVLLARRAFWRAAPLPVMVVPLLGFVALLGIQYAADRVAYGGQALAAALYIAWTVLLILLACGLRREIGLTGIATVLAWFLAVGGVTAAVLAVLQHYQISEISHAVVAPKNTALVYGNLAQANHFAHYSALALASLGYLYAAGRLHGAGFAGGAGLLVFVIGLTGSRSAVLFLALLLVLALLYAWRRAPGGGRLACGLALAIAAFAAAQWLATLTWVEPSGGAETVSGRLVGEGGSGATNIAHRLQVAREAWEMFLRAPFLGVGWGQFPWNDFDHRALHGPSLGTWPFNHAHNLVLQLLAETGLAGTSLIAGAGGLWLYGLTRARVDLEHWWLVALLGVIAVHSLLEHPLWYAYFLGIAAVALGLLAGQALTLRLERTGPPLLIALLVAGLLYAASVLHNYRSFEQLFQAGAVQPGDPGFAAVVSRAHREPLLTPYAELAIASTMALERERLREKLDLNGRVMRFAPIAGVVYRQAILLALDGKAEAAARQLEGAARVYPGELPNAIKTLSELSARNPAELMPLIKLATARLVARRAERNGRQP